MYFMTNRSNSVLYIGVTGNLEKRVSEHKSHAFKGFTDRYNCEKLVYYEEFPDIVQAIAREKALKNWRREWKDRLVDGQNPEWKDLME